jgi:hypothetical protein
MTYIPTEWKTGDIVTAERLNHAEQGIADAGGSGDTVVYNVRKEGNIYKILGMFANMWSEYCSGKRIILSYQYNNNVGTVEVRVPVLRIVKETDPYDAIGGYIMTKALEMNSTNKEWEFYDGEEDYPYYVDQ